VSPQFWYTVTALGVPALALFNKHLRFLVLHFFKGVKKSTSKKPSRKKPKRSNDK